MDRVTDEPLVIVGSRLQAITTFAIAVAIGVALVPNQPLWALACIGLCVFAASRMVLRLALFPDRAEWRTWRGERRAPRGELSVDLGHRYVDLRRGSDHIKIEVPVEVRPNVRSWVDGPMSLS